VQLVELIYETIQGYMVNKT